MKRSTLTSVKQAATKPNRRAPADIPKELRPLYLQICDHLEAGGRFVRDTDERLVRQYIHALNEAERARAQVEADGMMLEGAGGQMKAHPLIAVANQARLTAVKISTVLALSPYSRQRIAGAVEAVAKADQPDDPWAAAAAKPKTKAAAKHLDA